MGLCLERCSHWMEEGSLPAFEKLERNLTVDVAVIGGGFTGIACAYALKRAGLKVALLERDRCGEGDTGHTTAHVTYVTDQRLPELARRFGKDHAGAVWDAGKAGQEFVEEAIEREGIACEWTRVPGYRHMRRPVVTPEESALESLREEAGLARELGFHAEFMKRVPVAGTPGIRFSNQATIHPLKYLRGMLEVIEGDGSFVFEESEVVEFGKQKHSLKVNDRQVRCGFVVIATEVPLQGEQSAWSGALFQSKLAARSSYVIGAGLPSGLYPQICLWDTGDPYDYVRIDRRRGFDYVIYGGEDHKTGQADDTIARFTRLTQRLKHLMPNAVVDRQWSGQVIDTVDGLPFIGEIGEGQFVATGFSGNGITFGALAAMMAADAVMKRRNPWSELLDPHRKKLSATWDYIKQNADYPYYMVKDRLARQGDSLTELAIGEGKILRLDGRTLACYRDPSGTVHGVACSCTHLGCMVHWNAAEKTWDCPCHGARFSTSGDVLSGPAEKPLERFI